MPPLKSFRSLKPSSTLFSQNLPLKIAHTINNVNCILSDLLYLLITYVYTYKYRLFLKKGKKIT